MTDHKIQTIKVTSLKPLRDTIISKDEIISLLIDLNILTFDQFIKKYWE